MQTLQTKQKPLVIKDASLLAEILGDRLHMMDGNERRFAESILSFYKGRGVLTERQQLGATKLALRLILERDKLFL